MIEYRINRRIIVALQSYRIKSAAFVCCLAFLHSDQLSLGGAMKMKKQNGGIKKKLLRQRRRLKGAKKESLQNTNKH